VVFAWAEFRLAPLEHLLNRSFIASFAVPVDNQILSPFLLFLLHSFFTLCSQMEWDNDLDRFVA